MTVDWIARGLGVGARQAVGLRMINPEQFRTAGMSDNTLWDTALARTLGDESVVFNLVDGRTYNFAASVVAANRSLRIRGNGTTFVQQANTSLFSGVNDYGVQMAISAVDNTESYDYSGNQGGSGTTPCAKITLAAGVSAPNVGDIFKIVSDDLLVGGTVDERRGEFATVGAVSGQDVYTTYRLRDAYTTNPRLAVLSTSQVIDLRDMNMTAAGASAGRNHTFLYMKGFYQPRFDLTGSHGYGELLTVVGCLKALGTVRGRDFVNDPNQLRFGYIVNSTSCESGLWDLQVERCRHGYTTNTNPVDVGSTDTAAFGRTAYEVVRGTATDCDLPFDTHSDAYAITFANCNVVGSRRGPSTFGSAFQLRGFRNRILGCQATNTRAGVRIYQEFDNGGMDNEVVDFGYEGPGPGLTVQGRTSSSELMRAYVRGGRFKTPGVLADVTCADVRIDGVSYRPQYSANAASAVSLQDLNTKIALNDVTADYADATGSGHRFFVAQPDGAGAGPAEIRAERLSIRNNTGKLALLGSFNSQPVNCQLIRPDLDLDPVPQFLDPAWNPWSGSVSTAVLRADYTLNGRPLRPMSRGNSDFTFQGVLFPIQNFDSPITGNRAVTLAVDQYCYEGLEVLFLRSAACTGGFAWNIGGLCQLREPNTYAKVIFTSGAWKLLDWSGEQILLRERVLFSLIGANMNSTADQPFVKVGGFSNYLVSRIVSTNASTPLTSAVGGVYTTASKGGTPIVAASQAYSGQTSSATQLALTIASNNRRASAPILSLTTAQGATATSDFYLIGTALD